MQQLMPRAVLDEIMKPVYGGIVIIWEALPDSLRRSMQGLFVLGYGAGQ